MAQSQRNHSSESAVIGIIKYFDQILDDYCIPVRPNAQVINRIYYDEESEEYVEETTEYKHNCVDLHRPHHLHRVSNFVGRPRQKNLKKKKDE